MTGAGRVLIVLRVPVDTADATFEVRSPRLAELTVARSRGTFGRTVGQFQRHTLGIADAPLYEVEQPYAPLDELWFFRRRAGGRFVDEEPLGSPVDGAYRRWASGSRAVRGHELVGHLPVGRYLFVRSARPACRARTVLLGNDHLPAAPNMRVLRPRYPDTACILGANRSLPPDLSQPLLGLAVLEFGGNRRTDGVVFLQFSSFGTTDPGPDHDLVLIIPVEGELVFDNYESYLSRDTPAMERAWRDRGAGELASWFADE